MIDLLPSFYKTAFPRWRSTEAIHDYLTDELIPTFEAGPNRSFIAENRAGKRIGFISLIEELDLPIGLYHIRPVDIAVTEHAECLGVCRILLRYAERWSAANGKGFINSRKVGWPLPARILYRHLIRRRWVASH